VGVHSLFTKIQAHCLFPKQIRLLAIFTLRVHSLYANSTQACAKINLVNCISTSRVHSHFTKLSSLTLYKL